MLKKLGPKMYPSDTPSDFKFILNHFDLNSLQHSFMFLNIFFISRKIKKSIMHNRTNYMRSTV